MKRVLQVFSVLAFLLVFGSGCASTQMEMVDARKDMLKDYLARKEALERSSIICPGFRLRIRHSADAQLTGEYQVDFKGVLSLPYKVKLRAAGSDLKTLGDRIEQAYSSYFRVKNNVDVEIVKREYLLELRGLVQKPGIYPVKLDTSLEEVMALGGGLSSATGPDGKAGQGDKAEYVRIVVPDSSGKEGQTTVRWVRLADYFLKYDAKNESLWRGGETLFFQMAADPDAFRTSTIQTLRVMGEVHRPGEYPLQPGADLHWYIGQSGGPTSTADLNNVVVIRKKADLVQTMTFETANAPLDVEPGDVVLVKSLQFKPSFVERIGPLIVSFGSLAVSVLVAILAL